MKKLRDWQTVTIGEIADRVTVGIATSTTQHYRDRGVPILRNLNIRAGRLDDADLMFISEDFDNANQAKRLRANDVITVRTGFAGVSCVIPSKYEGAQTFTTLITSPRPELLNSSFMALHLNSDLGDREFYRLTGDAGRANLNAGALREYILDLPTLPEQRKIAEILGTWDEALEKLDAMIQAKERRKKALMQQLLTGKKRINGCSEPWVNCKLGQLFNERVEQGRCDLPLLSITANRGVVSRGDLAKRDTSPEDKSKYLRIVPGDIGYNTMRMWQGVSALSSIEGIVSPAYTVCTPTQRIDGRFAAHFLKLPHTIHLLHRYSQGLVDDTLNLKFPSFAVIEVTIPYDLKEQRVITEILDCCDEELRLLRAERDALDQQKRGLMQRLLTGKVRVKL